MAEGLNPVPAGKNVNPVPAGKKQHDHGTKPDQEATKPDQEAEPPARPGAGDRHSRIVQVGEALLLALVTVAAAWTGYAAARWGTVSRVEIAQASTLRGLATRHDLSALSIRNFDSASFNAWYIAFTLNNKQKEAIAERRFRPQFRVAFNAWMATDPAHNPHAPPGPTYMPEYKLADLATAKTLDDAANAKFQAGNQAGLVSDDYIRITVFLAAVLFLVGIGSTFKLHGIRYALITFGSLLLILSTVLILRQPGLPS
jgi:hypothetical protein